MRPPEFTGGNRHRITDIHPGIFLASMRPPEFTGGNACTGTVVVVVAPALQ